jgi:hypothetical protein
MNSEAGLAWQISQAGAASGRSDLVDVVSNVNCVVRMVFGVCLRFGFGARRAAPTTRDKLRVRPTLASVDIDGGGFVAIEESEGGGVEFVDQGQGPDHGGVGAPA